MRNTVEYDCCPLTINGGAVHGQLVSNPVGRSNNEVPMRLQNYLVVQRLHIINTRDM